MKAVILSIGDELALGQTVDTNAAYLSAQLAQLGITIAYHLTVPDVRHDVHRAFAEAADRADLIIATGGLGPTDDDLTRDGLADALNTTLALDADALAEIDRFFAERDRTMIERNKVQAMCPVGADLIPNNRGTAPGIHAMLKGAEIWVMPGVPREMVGMFDDHIKPTLVGEVAHVILTRKINTFGMGESDLAHELGDLAARDRNPLVGTTVAQGVVSVRIRSEFPTQAQAQQELDATTQQLESLLGDLVFGRETDTLADAVAAQLTSLNQSVATAESCTGGLVAKQLTDIDGASNYFRAGWVTYANESKTHQLDVPAELITQHGAVSEQVAQSMARHAQQKSNADYALALTGIAGPTGATTDKPVGLVFIALAQRDLDTAVSRHVFPGDRAVVRQRAANTALNLLRLRTRRPA
ncbi:MAG: competence/damage-inducible protein A [Planctomycetaceae bacterium]|nr:competence/damage-inducible protein A [Planctomycetaceae bacterium]